MKKILIIIATASLLFACDKTENEQDILNIFFGEDINENRLSPESYDGMQPTEDVYFQEFNNAATSDWSEKNDDSSIQGIMNGELIIQGKKSYYVWKNFSNLNQSKDFQMEIRAQFNFAAVKSAESYMGIVYGVDNDKNSFNYIALFNGDQHVMQIGNYDGKTYNNWYAKPSGLTKNVHHVYTIRKAGSELYFFADKKLKYHKKYEYFPPNYGFWLNSDCIISADYVKLSYLEMNY